MMKKNKTLICFSDSTQLYRLRKKHLSCLTYGRVPQRDVIMLELRTVLRIRFLLGCSKTDYFGEEGGGLKCVLKVFVMLPLFCVIIIREISFRNNES